MTSAASATAMPTTQNTTKDANKIFQMTFTFNVPRSLVPLAAGSNTPTKYGPSAFSCHGLCLRTDTASVPILLGTSSGKVLRRLLAQTSGTASH